MHGQRRDEIEVEVRFEIAARFGDSIECQHGFGICHGAGYVFG